MNPSEQIIDPGRAIIAKFLGFVPNLVAAFLILLGGYFLAKLCRLLAIKLFEVTRFDIAAEKAGIDEVLAKAEIKQTPAELMGGLVYWIVILMVFMVAINALGLEVASQLLNEVLLYIPRVVAAILIFVLGLFLANLLSGIVKVSASNAGFAQAETLGTISRIAIIILAVAMSLDQLGVATRIVVAAFSILFGAICLALALAFGLGCRDLAGKFIEDQIEKSRGKKKKE